MLKQRNFFFDYQIFDNKIVLQPRQNATNANAKQTRQTKAADSARLLKVRPFGEMLSKQKSHGFATAA